MSKVVIQRRYGKTFVINRLTYPEMVNERVYNAIVSGMLDSLLPVSIKKKGKETRLECCVQGFQTINQYFAGLVSKQMFLDLVYQITLIIKGCEKNMVSANNLDLEKDRIFIDPITRTVKCIFWPVVNNQRSDPPQEFLKQLHYGVRFNPAEDDEYLGQYAAFFYGYDPFSINSFEKLILKLQGKKPNAGNITPLEALSGRSEYPTDPKNSKAEDTGMEGVEYDPLFFFDPSEPPVEDHPKQPPKIDYVFCPVCGQKNSISFDFCGACGNKLTKGTTLGDQLTGTMVLGHEEPEHLVFPTLLRSKTGEEYYIDIPVFRIGTEQAHSDLVIPDNHYISRRHAEIITRDEHFYVVDKNSTNKTFVDGRLIAGETEVEIFDGTVLKLANEEFVFSLKETDQYRFTKQLN